MDLSSKIQNCSEQFPSVSNKVANENYGRSQGLFDSISDILDVSDINLEDEECWLYETRSKNDKPVSIFTFLYDEQKSTNSSEDYKIPQISSKAQKAFDTRTFTRPKKKLTRPRLDQLEHMYSSSNSDLNEMSSSMEGLKKSDDSGVFINETGMEKKEIYTPNKPLHFDLTQPSSSFYLDNMICSTELDSFQNMSPPSLVNSLCSSTFANLMESSFIKNDPVLREIRDTDYTETVLLQDTEAPLFQSITGSCSSINSDTPENFLKKVSYNSTFRRNTTMGNKLLDVDNSVCNSNSASSTQSVKEDSFILNETLTSANQLHKSTEEIIDAKVSQSFGNLNGTYRRSPKINRKTDPRFATRTLNSTFDFHKHDASENSNSSKCSSETVVLQTSSSTNLTNTQSNEKTNPPKRYSFILHDNKDSSVENMKKRYSDQNMPTIDLNKLTYCDEKHTSSNTNNINNETFIGECNDLNRTVDIKRSSLGSADSLDRMSSSLSNSSKGSNKMLNMSDVDAIVEMQERSLAQVMSTPKPNTNQLNSKTMFETHFISPITNTAQHLSDSELSSNDEYKSSKSNFSSKVSLDNFSKQPAKSLGYLGPDIDAKLKTTNRSTFTLSNQNQKNPLQAIADNIRGSYGNIKTIQPRVNSNIGGSYSNLYRPSNAVRPPSHQATSNLKTMGTRLKGSYTSLRPISANLPVAPPVVPDIVNTTVTVAKGHSSMNSTHVVDSRTKLSQVEPILKEKTTVAAGDSTFVRPQIPRASGLPRPTGIPRPATSKIPGPRISTARPSTSRTKVRQNEHYY